MIWNVKQEIVEADDYFASRLVVEDTRIVVYLSVRTFVISPQRGYVYVATIRLECHQHGSVGVFRFDTTLVKPDELLNKMWFKP